ncbi:DUF3892 domain-containing protein [Clostridium tertium]|jgi:Protein of unknown function (DUF3892)|uniref:DUF3892 domain-containing protein n=1 Tax=Clostridium TaxID=1485 RepID=UPI00155AD9DD|nr:MULTISPECIES: DUF3892 domain-containing protein [Clostridium]MBS5308049.1 DUF3892 domain-containing protein [Clostridium sp.]MDB1922857.1 DUF3892 domain-containing protein [Clostridium tertium]MDB1925861.1 DUF3892 domain-containing protein [Clostridium tertium]MDB1929414.1 DUF3892 domain-containing protein [Clostridium tertium]MDB1933962.1 DUF3892 domain-containing protein [Clostridium tertium]
MNKENDGMIGRLPININKEVPTPNSDAESIKALIKKSGEVVGYELSNGERVSKEEGVQMAKNGQISGVAVGVSKKGEEYLRSLPDQSENNNLSSLPTVE